MTLIERIQACLRANIVNDGIEDYYYVAVSLLRAIREPTDEIKSAPVVYDTNRFKTDVGATWTNCIDEALKCAE